MAENEKDLYPVLHAYGWDGVRVPKAETALYAITGNESQVLTVKLQSGDVLRGEPGTMFYLSDGVEQRASCDECYARCCTCEDVRHARLSSVLFSNSGSTGLDSYAALTPNFPTAKVVPVDLSSPDVGGAVIAQKGAYMASYGDVHVEVSCDTSCLRCCCGGMGMVRQRLTGNGTVFLSSSGTIVQKVLQAQETILVDTECLLAFASTCKMDLRRAGGVMGMVGGGQGIFNTTVTGPGLVIIQSMNEAVFLQALAAEKLYRR